MSIGFCSRNRAIFAEIMEATKPYFKYEVDPESVKYVRTTFLLRFWFI